MRLRRLDLAVSASFLVPGAAMLHACASSPGPFQGLDASLDADRGESGASGSSSGGGSGGSSGGAGSSGAGSDDGGPTGPVSVLQHHMSATRDGLYADAAMNKQYAGTLRRDPAFSPPINGDVYAQPLYVTDGPGGREAFVVATEGNHVTAVDGAGNVLWDQGYGTPVTSGLQCAGNINPLGITGTPVIDPTSRTVYFDAMTSVGGTPTHMIHAVSLDTGMEQAGWPPAGLNVDMYVPGFVSKQQNQRGALLLVHGVLHVPYGGLLGDCGSYLGYVIGIPVANPTMVTAFSTGGMFPTGSAAAAGATKGGIWAAGGIAATSDGSSLFVTTGNTSGNTSVWSGGEAVLRLSPGPIFTNTNANEFHPANWAALDDGDVDLGGANPVVFDMPGAPVPHLVAAFGKDGYLYLLNRDDLGGMGGNLSRAAVASQNAGSAGSLNAAGAAYTTSKGTYLAYRINLVMAGTGCPAGQNGNLGVALVSADNPPTASVVWCSSETGLGSPMVTRAANGDVIVWDANTRLYGYDGDTGEKIFDGGGAADAMASGMHYYNSTVDVGGRILVATSGPGRLYIFHP
jgi:hypothetical protein